jgi:hypothetical protein
MPASLKKIDERVIVITGATSGVGRVTPRQAAKRGGRLAPPVDAPEIAASAILFAAQDPRRDVYVGGAAKFASASSRFAPRITGRLLNRTMFWMQRSDRPALSGGTGLHVAAGHLRERHGSPLRVREWSLYTQSAIGLRPTSAAMLGRLFAAGYRVASRPERRLPSTRRPLPDNGGWIALGRRR